MEQGFKNADAALSENPEIAVLTSGISMRPMLRQHRDIVIIERVNRRLKVGDVPLYRREGCERFVLHRIVKITDNGYVIRGDNLYQNEYTVTDDDIIGVLKAFYRDGKYYDCAKSRAYKAYSVYIRLNYPIRWLWRVKTKPFLARITPRPIKKLIMIVVCRNAFQRFD